MSENNCIVCRVFFDAIAAVRLPALAVAFCLIAFSACPALAAEGANAKTFSGNVSWYGSQFNGKKTASGEIFDMKKCTAAHLKFKFGTKILVENPRNGKSVVVKVNDRGPYAKGRVMDLSRGAAEKLGILLGGVAFVDCTVLGDDGAKSMERLIISEGDLYERFSIELITAVSTAPSHSS